MSTNKDEGCLEVQEHLADLLEGLASQRMLEHVAACDDCRDLRYEAERVLEASGEAGADFRAPEGFADRLVNAVLAARPEGPDASAALSTVAGPASTVEPSREASRLSGDVERASRESAVASAPTELAVEPVDAPETQRTVLEPPPRFDEEPAQKPTRTAFVPSVKTMPIDVSGLRAGSPVSPTQPSGAPEGAASAEHRSAPVAEQPARVAEAVTGRADTGSSAASAPQTSGDVRRASATLPSASVASAEPAPTAAGGGASVVSLFRKKGFLVALVGGMAAAAAVGALVVGKGGDGGKNGPVAFTEGAWSGSVSAVARASADGQGGLEVCKDGCRTLASGATFEPGSTLKTDPRTRARVTLADGTTLSLDRSSEVVLPEGASREAKVMRGLVVADVENVAGAAPAKLVLPQGHVEVLGTKLTATVTDRRATVEVLRGEVNVVSTSGTSARVRAGEEATLADRGEPVVTPRASMSDAIEWSDASEAGEATELTGIGELRAKKPGEAQERAKAVRLSKHGVKVRIVDVVARTEIDETFTNDTDDELEGIFRFPLPPGAQIERLALEVDGQLIEGAFVDRDKGAAIWRGVIQNAAPKTPRPREEIIWVPGPWRDPALLEWQRGGRFELRIFPIPKRGSRRVVLTYTQTVPQSAGVRRFSYPLAHDASGSTKIDSFDVDLQVLGHDPQFGVETRGYALQKATSVAGGDRFALHEQSFVPSGDLTVEYALPNRDAGVTAWAYQMASTAPVASAPPVSNAPPVLRDPGRTTALSAAERAKEADLEAKASSDDASPFVAISLRPRLPRFAEGKERLHVIVVDASRSMVGERFTRASRLAASVVREMDRRDQFMVLACDTTCQPMVQGAGRGLPSPLEPSAEAAQEVERFLGSIEPDGGTNLVTAMQAARSAGGVAAGRKLEIIYLGDGTPTVGPSKPATIEAAVRHVLPAGDASVVAVALGADADTTTLAALARGGGGVVVPYVPGQRVQAAAVDVLASAYGSVLSDVTVELPPGLAEVTPARIDPVPAGGEAFVFARMRAGDQASGDVVVRGRVGNDRFEQRYPIDLKATTNAGNAFVPRMFAAAKIADLEQVGRREDRERIVALSKRFGVASRHTSMIVLESEAMFKAFGLDKNGISAGFTGETGALSAASRGDASDEQGEAEEGADGLGDLEREKKKGESPKDDFASPAEESLSVPGGLGGFGAGGGGRAAGPSPAATAAPAPAPPAKSSAKKPSLDTNDPFSPSWNQNQDRDRRPITRPAPNSIPMRRVFDRKASFAAQNQLATEVATTLAEAEGALRIAPDSRDKTVQLYKALMASGRVGEAQELVARWAKRDALDPDALLARADLAAMAGDRPRAVRILSGLADVRPGDKTVQRRLVSAFDRMGAPDVACHHRLALADIASDDVDAVSQAVRCAQDQGFSLVSQSLVASAPENLRARIETTSRTVQLGPPVQLSGDVRVAATWNAPVDLDLAIVDKNGRRTSWLGTTTPNLQVTAQDTTSARTETLALAGLASGQYVLEVVRASDVGGAQPVSGEVTLTMPGGEVRRIPFTMQGSRAELGTVRVFFTSRLVPVSGGLGMGPGGWGTF